MKRIALVASLCLLVIYLRSDAQITRQTGAGTVTNVTATSPIVSSGGATPDISCPTCATTSGSPSVSTTFSAAATTGSFDHNFGNAAHAADCVNTSNQVVIPTTWTRGANTDSFTFVGGLAADTTCIFTIGGTGLATTLAIPTFLEFVGGICQNVTGTVGFSTPTSNPAVANCVTGSNTQLGVSTFTATGQSVQGRFTLPSDWVSGAGNNITFTFRSAGTTGNVVWAAQTACVATTGETLDPAFNTAQTASAAAQGTTLRSNTSSITTFTTTGCAASETLIFKVSLDASTTTTGDIDIISVIFQLKRNITLL